MKNQLKTIVLLGALTALLVGIGGSIGPGYLYLFTALAVALNLGVYFFSDRIVLALHRARAIDPLEAPGLHRVVEELARRAGLPKPRVFFIDEPQANAFATGRSPKHAVVAVTRGILEILDERELRGVLAHEIAHVKNRDILVASIAAALATAITHLAHALSFAGLFGGRREEDEASPAGGLRRRGGGAPGRGPARARERAGEAPRKRRDDAARDCDSRDGEPVHRQPARTRRRHPFVVLHPPSGRGADPTAARHGAVRRLVRPRGRSTRLRGARPLRTGRLPPINP